MRTFKSAWLGVVPALLIAASSAAARPIANEQGCVFDQFGVSSVAPYNIEEDYGLGAYTRLMGAQVYVAAQPGLTAEWLTLNVQRAVAAQSAASDQSCTPNVRGLQVSVVPAGAGFWVVLRAPDERSATSVLHWARSIVPASRAGA